MAKKHAKMKDKPEAKVQKGNARAAKGAVEERGAVTPGEELSNKEYERELKRLHVELVNLQQWIVHKGLRVCIVFEGRDGAGKGGTIKAITERVSPRVFRVIALPAPTEREKTHCTASATCRTCPPRARA